MRLIRLIRLIRLVQLVRLIIRLIRLCRNVIPLSPSNVFAGYHWGCRFHETWIENHYQHTIQTRACNDQNPPAGRRRRRTGPRRNGLGFRERDTPHRGTDSGHEREMIFSPLPVRRYSTMSPPLSQRVYLISMPA